MPWVRIDDAFPDHRKVAELGFYAPLGGWLFLCGLAYCNRQLTDGRIPKHHVHRLASFRHLAITNGMSGEDIDADVLAAMLVAVRLWEDAGDHFIVHDYHVYQPSREEVEAERQQKSDAGRRGGLARAKALAKARAKAGAKAPAKAGATSGAVAGALAPALAPALAGAQAESKPVPVPDPDPLERSSLADRPGALRGKESEETQPPAGAKSTGAAAPGHTRSRTVGYHPPERPGFGLVVELVRAERDRLTAAQIPFDRGDLVEQCKLVAARSHLVYDGALIGRALDALEHTERAK